MTDLMKSSQRQIDCAIDYLERNDWRPSRRHIEANRNLTHDLATELTSLREEVERLTVYSKDT